MFSFSFYIPDGKESWICTGKLVSPIKIIKESLNLIKLRFDSYLDNKEVFEFKGDNTDFSIVYNK